MANKTPVRVVFNDANVATGMAEFQSGDTIPFTHGGTGLSSLGSAGQVIRVNDAGNALEFGANSGSGISLGDMTAVGSTLSSPSNADLTLQTSGSGNVVVENLSINGDGAVVTGILDEDAMGSNSNVKLATQQSIKAYVDAQDAAIASDTLTFTNKTIDANGSGNNISNIDIANMTAAVVVTESEGIGSNDNDTTLPTSAAVKDYVDNNSGSPTSITQGNTDVTVTDSGTGNVSVSVDGGNRLTVTAATTTTATGHTITLGPTNTTTGGAIKFLEGSDNGTNTVTLVGPASTANKTLSLPSATDTLVGKATTDTFTNKSIDADNNTISNIEVDNLKSGVLDTDISSVAGTDTTLASAKAIKTYVDAQIATKDNTDEITEGSSNLYFTNARADARITNALKDEDNMASDSATHVPSQQSVKAYVDAQDAAIASDTLTLTNKTFDAEGTGNALSNVDVANLKSGVLDTDLSSVSGSDDTIASAKAIKTYVDAQVTAQDLDFATDDSTALSIDLDSESLQVSGGANITTSGSGNTITIKLDTALAGLSSVTSTALVTNKISSSDSTAVRLDDALNVDGALDVGAGFTISNTTSITSILDEDAMGSNSATALATQQSIKAYVDANDLSLIDEDNFSTNSASRPPSQQSVKAYADTKAVLSGSTNNQITTVTGAHAIQGESNLTFDGTTLAVTGAVTISGDLTVSGDTATVSTTNTAISDNIIELNTGISQSFNDAGIIIERGTTGNNAAIIWDESADTFVLGTTTATAGDKSGGITIDAGSLKINSLEVDGVTVTDNVITSNSSNADLEINANGSGTVVLENLSVAGDGATVTGIKDEDNMASNSNVKLATQQSIKAYADTKAVLSGSTNNQVATVTGAHALTGESNLTFDGSTLGVAGTQTITNTTTNASLTITTTEDSASAGPVVELKRNSGSPADADYLGQINFKGENDADQEVLYAKITGKILDASDGTEDGILEFAHKKAGSNVITGRFRSDSFQLLNGTTLSVDGQITGNVTGDLTGTADVATAVTVADESSDTSCNVLFTTAATGNLPPKSGTNLTFNSSSGVLTATGFAGALTGNVTGNVSGTSGSTTGNAATATALATARNIAGQSFDGTAAITIASTDLSNTSAIALLTASQTMTNKTLTSPQINTQVDFLARAEARFQDASGGQYVALEAPATVSSSVTFTLPAADGTSGQVIQTDGSGALSFADGGSDGNSPNSTISALPGSEGNFDLTKTNNTGDSETPFATGGTDAFGVNLGAVYSMMDPIGSTSTTDLGSGEAYVGA